MDADSATIIFEINITLNVAENLERSESRSKRY